MKELITAIVFCILLSCNQPGPDTGTHHNHGLTACNENWIIATNPD